ncbi:hypothetical protein DFS33DRAFT_147715 [Desarmillaria ectypa]|nr:hypothetical protein DFS33DRAFT_147715 [Desarmillaria ectypa]
MPFKFSDPTCQAHNIPNTVALPSSAFGSYDLLAIMKWLFPARSNPVPIALLANHKWVAQPNGRWKLERYSAAEAFPETPDDEMDDNAVPTLNHYPPDGLPVNSSVDLLDGARKLEDGRLEVQDALGALWTSVTDATLLYTQARLALDEERAKTTSLIALVTNICGQAFADTIVQVVEAMDTDDGEEEDDGESSDNQHSSNFTQKQLQPSPWQIGVNKALSGDSEWASNMKGASDALREDVHVALMPPPNFLPRRTTNHAGQSSALLASRSTISPRKRSRSFGGEDESTSPKRIKIGIEEGSLVQAQAESSAVAVLQGQKTTFEPKYIEGRSPVDLDNSNSDEREEEPLNTGTSDGLQQSSSPSQLPDSDFLPQQAISNPEDQQMSPPCETQNPVVPPQQALGSFDPDSEDSDSDSDSDMSSSDSDLPLISWSSVVGAISNGISAVIAWYTNPPPPPPAEESISARRPTRPRAPTPPSTIYRPHQPRVLLTEPLKLRRTMTHMIRSEKTGRSLLRRGNGTPEHPHIVEGDDFLDMDTFYEKEPLSTLTRYSEKKTVGYLSDQDAGYVRVYDIDLRDEEVKEYCERHFLEPNPKHSQVPIRHRASGIPSLTCGMIGRAHARIS